jgi:hypothetical protein
MEGQCPMKQDKKISRVSNHDDWNKEEKKQVKDWGVAFKLDDCNAGDSQSRGKDSTVGRCNKLRETSEFLFGAGSKPALLKSGTNPYFSSVQAASASMFLVVNHSRLCSLPKYCRRWRRMD